MTESSLVGFAEGYRQMLGQSNTSQFMLTEELAMGNDAVTFLRNEPDQAPTTMFTLTEEQALMWQEGGLNFNGELGFEKRPTLLWSVFPATCMTINTLDPDIKTVVDLAGKRIHLWDNSGVSAAGFANMTMVLKAAGVFNSATLITGGKNPTDALADREVDAITGRVIFADSQTATSDSETRRLAILTGTLRFVDIPSGTITSVREQNPEWVAAGTLQRMVLKPGYARAAFGTDYDVVPAPELNCLSGNGVHWGISPDADAEAVYQMTKAIIDNVDIGNTHWPYLMPQWGARLGHIWAPAENFHPGAKRAYEETGTSFGTVGIRQWEAANPSD